jgi:hypothetical protein
MAHIASCCCGQLQLKYEGEIRRSSVCHCLECQRRTGSAFGLQTRVERSKTIVTGNSTVYQRTGDDPKDGFVTFHFCPICGSTVYWELSGMDEHFVVAAGAFADRSFPAPVFSVYEDRMLPWVKLPDSVETHWA